MTRQDLLLEGTHVIMLEGYSTLFSCSRINNLKGMVVSLDAEKALDRIEWDFLFFTLKEFDLGKEFIEWVKLIYHNPVQAVITNGKCSPCFTLGRQAITTEPLAGAIRTHPTVYGISSNRIRFPCMLMMFYCLSRNLKYLLCQFFLLLMSLVSFLVTKYILISQRPCHWVRCNTPFPPAYHPSGEQQKVLFI